MGRAGRYYPASMDLTGLTTETTYNIFCYSIDDEIPTANVMQVADIQATLHTITTWDGAHCSRKLRVGNLQKNAIPPTISM